MTRDFAGIVLAGGLSSRMGQDKALLRHQGQRLVDIMAEKLKAAGACEVLVSGHIEGYRCLGDKTPGAGPARAILDMAGDLKGYTHALFVPVDIPLIRVDQLKVLAAQMDGGYYAEHFLPAFIPMVKLPACDPAIFAGKNLSVWRLLEALDIQPLPVAEEDAPYFLNVNTPDEYQRLSAV